MARYVLDESAQKIYGYNGIKGDRFEEVAGWEKGTAGFAGNIYSRLASENGIQPVDPAITGSREPYKTGRFITKLLRNVPWFDKKVMYAWRYIIEDTALGVDGIQDYTFDTIKRTHGVIRQDTTYLGIFKETNGEFTIKTQEIAGQLVRKSIDYWLGGLSDPKTGVATFYGKDVRDLQPNKSMTIMYILLGPTCRPNDIEYACIWHDAVITTSKHTHNNSATLGEAGQGQDHDLNFAGIFDRGPQVDLLASIIVDREGLYEERSYNALLPQYIYDQYLSDVTHPDREDFNITIANRLRHELEDPNARDNQPAYTDSKAYDAIKSTHSNLFQDGPDTQNNGIGNEPGMHDPQAPFPG
jgi:hypothetical protein